MANLGQKKAELRTVPNRYYKNIAGTIGPTGNSNKTVSIPRERPPYTGKPPTNATITIQRSPTMKVDIMVLYIVERSSIERVRPMNLFRSGAISEVQGVSFVDWRRPANVDYGASFRI